MALIKCPECNREISDSADMCPICGYRLKQTIHPPKKKSKLWIIPVVIIVIVAIIFAYFILGPIVLNKQIANSTTSDHSVTQKIEDKKEKASIPKDATIDQILSAEVDAAVKKITDEYTALSNDIGTTYGGYKKSADKITAWYSLCESESKNLYGKIVKDMYSYYEDVAKDGLDNYETWNKSMTDGYKAWNRAMEDYFKACNRLYEDANKNFSNIISDAYKEVSYDEASDAYEKMYNNYEDAYGNAYDNYEDALDDMYDFYEDVWDEFYDGGKDVKAQYEKIFNK